MRVAPILTMAALFWQLFSLPAGAGGIPETQSKRERIHSDSIAADAQADRRIDSLSRVMDVLSGRIAVENKALSSLKGELSVLAAAREAQDRARLDAAGGAHSAVIVFDGPIASCKGNLRDAQTAADIARSDSVDASKRISQQETGLLTSESAMEHSLAGLHRQSDSLSSKQKKLEQDSVSAWKADNDSLNAVSGLLNDLRRSMAVKDSSMKAATADLNSSRADSMAAAAAFASEGQARGRATRTLDSLIPALQGQKTGLLHMQEKLQLDSVIQDLSDQLQDFLRKSYDERSAASGPEVQKEQMLDAYKGKRDNLLRDEAIIGMMATFGDISRQEWDRRVGDLLVTTQKKLDSAFAAQEKNERDGVVNEKQFLGATKGTAARNGTLSVSITRMSRELINAKPRIEKLERDSAAALKRRESDSEAYGKARAAVAAALAMSAVQSDSVTRLRDSLKTFIAGKEISFQKQRDDFHAGVSRAADTLRRVQSVLDSILALQQKARSDSSELDRQKSVLVAQARQVMEMKQDEIKVKGDQIELIAAELAKAKNESISAVQDKRQQQEVFRQMIQELDRQSRQEELSIADLERKRNAALAASSTQKPAPGKPAAESAQDQLALIYELIDKGSNAAARKAYGVNREFLKKNLFPEAFAAIKTTIEALEPETPKAAPAASAGKKKAPVSAASVPAPAPPAPVVAPTPQPEPEPDVPRKEASVFISSVPPVASIFMDGVLVGKTNVGNVKVTSGKHMMQFLKGGLSCTVEMYFVEGVNPAQIVKLPCGQ